jgi:hypothetical protein
VPEARHPAHGHPEWHTDENGQRKARGELLEAHERMRFARWPARTRFTRVLR